jgi:hypothetical protein
MSNKSIYLQDKLLNWVRGTTMGTAPSALYVGLFNGDPTDAGSGGTEVTTTIHPAGRVAVTFGAPSGGSMSNSGIVDFGTAAGNASLTHFAIFDAASSGNMLASASLGVSAQTASTGNQVSYAVGALTWSED